MKNESQGGELGKNLWRAVARYSYISGYKADTDGGPCERKDK